ncbi:hypothetical protein ACFVFS_38360 [Kitasatospora sp. NPDC057692]|uniref:hypothetical protein n=1 Tax=Kitasatospora sp. NPDC057692 TaxID=3346215 RepID=UPI0036AF8142
MEAQEKGELEDEADPPAMLAQLLASLVVFGGLASWATRQRGPSTVHLPATTLCG